MGHVFHIIYFFIIKTVVTLFPLKPAPITICASRCMNNVKERIWNVCHIKIGDVA